MTFNFHPAIFSFLTIYRVSLTFKPLAYDLSKPLNLLQASILFTCTSGALAVLSCRTFSPWSSIFFLRFSASEPLTGMALGGSTFWGVDPAGGGVQSFPVAVL